MDRRQHIDGHVVDSLWTNRVKTAYGQKNLVPKTAYGHPLWTIFVHKVLMDSLWTAFGQYFVNR